MTGVDNENPKYGCHSDKSVGNPSVSHSKLMESLKPWQSQFIQPSSSSPLRSEKAMQCLGSPFVSVTGQDHKLNPTKLDSSTDVAVTCFATHGSLGVVDLGATKTVNWK